MVGGEPHLRQHRAMATVGPRVDAVRVADDLCRRVGVERRLFIRFYATVGFFKSKLQTNFGRRLRRRRVCLRGRFFACFFCILVA